MTLGIELLVGLKNWLLDLFRVEDDRSVTTRDDLFLLVDSLNQRVDRSLEAILQDLLFHLKFFLRAVLLAIDNVFKLYFALV